MIYVDVYTRQVEGEPVTLHLYRMLKERRPYQSISHREMPTFLQHKNFVESKPYKHWYAIALDEGELIGSVYISMENEIGIFVAEAHQRKGYGRAAVEWIMKRHPQDRFLANINPQNEASIDLFEKLGFNLIQLTMAKDKE